MSSPLKWVMCPECYLRFQIRIVPLLEGCCFGCMARAIEIEKLEQRVKEMVRLCYRYSSENSNMGFALDNARADAADARARDPRSSYQGG